MYRVELWPSDKGPGGPKQGIFESPAWISSIRSDTNGGGGSKTFLPGAAVGGTTSAVLPTLAERLVAAMKWQLTRSRSRHGLGVLKITEANWRGVGQDNVGASSAMWDLLRSGYLDAWLNVRFIESAEAMTEMHAAGLVPPVLSESGITSIKKSFAQVFGTRAGRTSWWGRVRGSGRR